MPVDFENIKVGDRVWVGQERYKRSAELLTVSRLTPTQILCHCEPNYDRRFSRYSGYEITKSCGIDVKIIGVSDPEEVQIELGASFPAGSDVAVIPETVGNKLLEVTLHNLTTDQVRELAGLVERMFAEKETA